MTRPAAVLTDIEGTTTPIAFVRDTLFPFARDRLARFVADHKADRAVMAEIAATRDLAPGREPVETLLGWMAEDAKVTPLKALQGMIWDAGYASGALLGDLYPDVAPALRAWHAAGIGLAVYSSGSVAAQRLIFGHSVAGDLASLFGGFFDTRTGPKREAASYAAIAAALGRAPGEVLFLSDVVAELDAAAAAGLAACQLVRPEDGTVRSDSHAVAVDFHDVALRYDLPHA